MRKRISYFRVLFVATSLMFLFTPKSDANIVGAGTQNFNPITNGLDFATVHSSKTLEPGILNLGAFLNTAVNSLPYVDTGVQSRTDLNDSLTSSDLNFGIGILPRLDIGFSFPALITQSIDNETGVRGNFVSTGSTEIRANAKWRFLEGAKYGVATILSTNFPRTRNDPYAGSDSGPTVNLEFAGDYTWSLRTITAFNIGVRKRSPGTPIPGSFIEPMGDQFIASAAISYLLEGTDTKFIGEVFGAVPLGSQGVNPSRNLTSFEALAGIKQDISQELSLHAGAGTELKQGVSSPDWRVYAGLNYTFGPVWNSSAEVKSRGGSEARERYSVGNILFEFDSDKMINDYPRVLASLVRELKRKSFKKLTIEGHTDSLGRKTYNMELSQRRANSIKSYLVDKEGIDAAKIDAVGLGPAQPVASNGNYQGRQANRRVEFEIER
jgi:outer membrane protein OmpA-like peptidoglycan-associated protein